MTCNSECWALAQFASLLHSATHTLPSHLYHLNHSHFIVHMVLEGAGPYPKPVMFTLSHTHLLVLAPLYVHRCMCVCVCVCVCVYVHLLSFHGPG